MPPPYFSVIIPTRNRPDLLRDALSSALWQDFDDFEVIVSDNYNDERTQAVLCEFSDNTRLRCVRTDRLLPMPAHWEFASGQAQGQYVLILTDRSVLKQHALKTIHATISAQERKVELCSWRWSAFDIETGAEFANAKCIRERDVAVLQSSRLAQDFAHGVKSYPYSLPRGLNSCYHRDLMGRVMRQWGTPFKPLSPDFFSAFMFMAESSEVLFIDRPMFISQGLDCSNGGEAMATTALSYLSTLGNVNWYAHVPIKAPLVENLIFEDYLAAQELAGGFLEGIDISWPAYFETCYQELVHKKGTALLSPNEISELFNEWKISLSQFDTAVQAETKRRVRSLFWLVAKSRLKNSFAGPLLRQIKRKADQILLHRQFRREKRTVLAVAGFE